MTLPPVAFGNGSNMCVAASAPVCSVCFDEPFKAGERFRSSVL